MYGLMIALGVVAAIELARYRWRARGGDPDDIYAIAFWAVPAGLIGARLYHLATDWRTYQGHWIDALKIWNGGLGIPGGMAAGITVGRVVARRRGMRLPPALDAVVPALPLAQAIGRLGNWWNQELFGRPTDLPWGLRDRRGQPAPRVRRRLHLPPHVPLRAALEPGAVRPAHLDRPQTGPASWSAPAHLRRGLLPRAPVGRGPAQRHRQHGPGPAHQHLDLDPRHPRRRRRLHRAGPAPPARGLRRALRRRSPLVTPRRRDRGRRRAGRRGRGGRSRGRRDRAAAGARPTGPRWVASATSQRGTHRQG